jgi:uncharacterized protein (DUF2141 family)
VFNLIKSHLGSDGASLSLQLQQAGSSGHMNLQNVYLKANAASIAELRNHAAVEKLTFSIGDAKSAQMQEEYDIPDEPEHFANEDNFAASYSDTDIPNFDAEYDYA